MAYYYADDSERARLIAGFRALAPFWKISQTYPHRDGYPFWSSRPMAQTGKAVGNRPHRRAHRNRTSGRHRGRQHYTVSACFGPVEYRAVAIPQKEGETE